MVKANGTVAKNIALYFLDLTEGRYTGSVVSKTVIQAKSLLSAGYTEDEIKSAIDYVLDKTSVKMYSLGYISTMINRILVNIDEDKKAEEAKRIIAEEKQLYENTVKEVKNDGESKERNRKKLDGFGVQSRFGEELDFDMFERNREDN